MLNRQTFLSMRAVAALLALCMLQACNRVIEVEPTEKKSHVQINVSPFYFSMEDMAPATRGDIADAATRLSFAVFDAEDKLVESVVYQNSSEDDFGTVELELYPGTYRLVAVAHSGEDDAVINSPSSATLPGLTFTDTFAEVQGLTVESDKDCDFTMQLPRLTSAFVLRLIDTPPADAKEIQVVVNSGGMETISLGIDPDKGLAGNNWTQTRTIPIKDFVEGKDVPVYFIGLFPTDTWPVTVKATAYATDGSEIISHTINNVPMVANQKTIASGTFFESQGTGTFTLLSEWSTEQQVPY